MTVLREFRGGAGGADAGSEADDNVDKKMGMAHPATAMCPDDHE